MKELSRKDYMGAKSTLCTGCGHDSITNHLITALFKSKVNPYKVAKLSGIGCSSKTPNYFLSTAQGFNAIHGRMAALATGVHLAQPQLKIIGISGDGDSASIGLGSFIHLLRRNVPMLYIVENNGVYGLTKGQLSATADKGTLTRRGRKNATQPIDLCSLAIEMGASFVARSFSGDAKQLVSLFNLALRHNGTAFIDVISPCITFANHEGSTKSYDYMKTQSRHLQELGFIQPEEEIEADYDPSQVHEIELFDGSRLLLKKTSGQEHDLSDQTHALKLLREAREQSIHLTGLFYWDQGFQGHGEGWDHGESPSHKSTSKLMDSDLTLLNEEETRPSKADFEEILSAFR